MGGGEISRKSLPRTVLVNRKRRRRYWYEAEKVRKW